MGKEEKEKTKKAEEEARQRKNRPKRAPFDFEKVIFLANTLSDLDILIIGLYFWTPGKTTGTNCHCECVTSRKQLGQRHHPREYGNG